MTDSRAIEPIARPKRNHFPSLYARKKKTALSRFIRNQAGKKYAEYINPEHKNNLSREPYKGTLNKINH